METGNEEQHGVAGHVGRKMSFRKALRVFFFGAAVLFGYLISYGPVVAVGEKVGRPRVAYILYEPVELLRCQSSLIYVLTEEAYALCGGTTEPYKRYYFKTRRRLLSDVRAPRGELQLTIDGLYLCGKENGIHVRKYPSGQVTRCSFEEGNAKRMSAYYPDGKMLCNIVFSEDGIADGVYSWRTNTGYVIAECGFERGVPVDGKAIVCNSGQLWDPSSYKDLLYYEVEPIMNSPANALVTFKEGIPQEGQTVILFSHGWFYVGADLFLSRSHKAEKTGAWRKVLRDIPDESFESYACDICWEDDQSVAVLLAHVNAERLEWLKQQKSKSTNLVTVEFQESPGSVTILPTCVALDEIPFRALLELVIDQAILGVSYDREKHLLKLYPTDRSRKRGKE